MENKKMTKPIDNKLERIEKNDIQMHEIETWNGYHFQVTAPKGTFKKIFNDAEPEEFDI